MGSFRAEEPVIVAIIPHKGRYCNIRSPKKQKFHKAGDETAHNRRGDHRSPENERVEKTKKRANTVRPYDAKPQNVAFDFRLGYTKRKSTAITRLLIRMFGFFVGAIIDRPQTTAKQKTGEK